jgi:Na+-transporting NADH:ubiquinone oxidoreductase subunit C
MQHNTLYTIGFAVAVCLVCSVVVSTAAVALRDRQQLNIELFKKKNVLQAAGLMAPDESLNAAQVEERFQRIEARVVDLRTGDFTDAVDPLAYDMVRAQLDPAMSAVVPRNLAQVPRVPYYAVVYIVQDEQGQPAMIVLPIHGKGLWSTLHGFLAVDMDGTTIRGITFYEHGETPGLGGEVDNPRWKSLWPGRKIYGPDGNVRIEVLKGSAGPPSAQPYAVDGIAGATITARGVTNMLHFWLDDERFGQFLQRLQEGNA